MMRTRLLMATWALALTALPARAGLYIPAEPQPWPLPASPRQFRTETLANLQSIISVDPEVMKRKVPTHVREQVQKLQEKVADQTATTEDRINLGGYLLL